MTASVFTAHAPFHVPAHGPAGHPARGFSLIELMVSLLIGLLLTLAMASALMVGENNRRTTGANTGMDQSGAYASNVLDVLLRNAGAGFMQSASPVNEGVLGCNLTANGLLPARQFPAPFAAFMDGNAAGLRVSPLLIAQNQSDTGSDVLVIMKGSGAGGAVARPLLTSAPPTLNLGNVVGINAGDLVLLSAPGTTVCYIEPVNAVTAPATAGATLTLGGNLYSGNLPAPLTSSGAYVTPLGNPGGGAVQFQLLGVGAGNTLYAYDLLNTSGSAQPQALADSVLALHALYGMDTVGDGKLHAWVDPGSQGYDINTVMTSPAIEQHIVAVRVALVLRSSLYEKCPVTASQQATATPQGCPSSLAAPPGWFASDPNPNVSSLGTGAAPQTLTLAPDPAPDTHYRYRVVEFVAPLRNDLLGLSS